MALSSRGLTLDIAVSILPEKGAWERWSKLLAEEKGRNKGTVNTSNSSSITMAEVSSPRPRNELPPVLY